MPNTVTGVSEFNKSLQEVIEAIEPFELSKIMAETVFEISQELVPVDTGELRDSGEIYVEGEEHGIRYNADHASAVEFGTSRMAAQPFLRPAAENRKEIERRVIDKVKKQVGV